MKPVVVLSHFFPFPPVVGAELRTSAIVKALSEITDVVLISQQREDGDLNQTKIYCKECILIKRLKNSHFERIKRRMFEVFNPFPSAGRLINIGGFKRALYSLSPKYQEAILFLEAIWLLDAIEKNDRRKIILNQHNLDSKVLQRRAQNATFPLSTLYKIDYLKQLKYEKRSIDRVTKIFVVSKEDEIYHREIFKGCDIDILPNVVEIEDYPLLNIDTDNQNLLMTGDFNYAPNLEGLKYFRKKIIPLLKRDGFKGSVYVAGRGSENLTTDENIKIYGRFEKREEIFSKAALSIVPILTGGGSRYKIIESLAMGIPVVSTIYGAEGIEFREGCGIYIAKDEDEFAKIVIQLLKNKEKLIEAGRNGRNFIKENYSLQKVREILNKGLKELVN